jgi:hypothetical protein
VSNNRSKLNVTAACRPQTVITRIKLDRLRSIGQGARMAGEAVVPETRYARLGPDRLAYQILGQGPPDLVFTMGSFSHVDMMWDDPQVALYLRRLASFSRLLRFDRRGTGASDPLPINPLPAWEA